MLHPETIDEARGELLDELLVLRIQEGSREAFGLLVERWQERLFRHARRFTWSDEAAWEVLQESWLAVARGIGQLRDPGAVRRWLYTIVTRGAASRVRALPRERSAEPGWIEEAPAPEAQGGEREEAVLALRRALGALRPDERALVELFYLEELSVWELSKVLEVPEGTVKSRLHACRRKLRDALERMGR